MLSFFRDEEAHRLCNRTHIIFPNSVFADFLNLLLFEIIFN